MTPVPVSVEVYAEDAMMKVAQEQPRTSISAHWNGIPFLGFVPNDWDGSATAILYGDR